MESASFQRGIGVGKQLADVSRGRSAKNRVGERVGHGIGVGMAGQAARVGNPDPPQHQRTTIDETV